MNVHFLNILLDFIIMWIKYWWQWLMTHWGALSRRKKAGKFKNVPFVLTDGPVKGTKVEPIACCRTVKQNVSSWLFIKQSLYTNLNQKVWGHPRSHGCMELKSISYKINFVINFLGSWQNSCSIAISQSHVTVASVEIFVFKIYKQTKVRFS